MIVDCFTLGWELDLLECRLIELDDVVQHFVISEASLTFQGNPKPLHYAEHRERFAPWADKITYLAVNLPNDNPWQREYAQRNAMNAVLATFPDDATIMISDVDEIPFPATLHSAPTDQPWVIDYTTYSMAVDWQLPYEMQCTVVAPNWQARKWGLAEMRRQRLNVPRRPGGWHFTWLGGAEMIAAKAAAFSHTESSVQDYVRGMGGRLYTEGYHVLGEKLIPVDVDDSFPRYIRAGHCPETWFRPRP
jgi:beta-1,4-mannosyl-glycoprotein beta-1,4-N-acetylglucosaminyltransferase